MTVSPNPLGHGIIFSAFSKLLLQNVPLYSLSSHNPLPVNTNNQWERHQINE